MTFRITNQVLGTTIFVNALPADVRLGQTDIGPSWNNRPAPKLIVEAVSTDPFATGPLRRHPRA
jgi:hypothetical protein